MFEAFFEGEEEHGFHGQSLGISPKSDDVWAGQPPHPNVGGGTCQHLEKKHLSTEFERQKAPPSDSTGQYPLPHHGSLLNPSQII